MNIVPISNVNFGQYYHQKNFNESQLKVVDIIEDALKTNVEFLRIAMTAVVDQMNYRDIAKKEFDLFGDGNVKLKTFYDQLGGLGFSPNIKATFFDVLEKIYNAYCYAK